MRSPQSLKVAIAEDNDEFRLTLRDILSYEPDMEVVALWRNGREVLEEIHHIQVDILLLDVSMPIFNGVETVRALQNRQVKTKIVMLTMHDESEIVLETLRLGASAYLIKDGSADEIIRAVREVAQGRGLVHPQVMPILLKEMKRDNQLSDSWKRVLTTREYGVLCELAKGKSNEQISDSLHITLKTAKNHVSHILAKLDVTDRAQAVLYAVREHWVEL